MKNILPWITIVLCIIAIYANYLQLKKKRESGKDVTGNYLTEGMCVGLCIGTAFGSEWMSLGILVGIAVGMMIEKQ